ncbi:MAG: hypothetical protein ACLPN6_26050 [Streptosporangiaceae bacterium]
MAPSPALPDSETYTSCFDSIAGYVGEGGAPIATHLTWARWGQRSAYATGKIEARRLPIRRTNAPTTPTPAT